MHYKLWLATTVTEKINRYILLLNKKKINRLKIAIQSNPRATRAETTIIGFGQKIHAYVYSR